jgi:hypothetical protein
MSLPDSNLMPKLGRVATRERAGITQLSVAQETFIDRRQIQDRMTCSSHGYSISANKGRFVFPAPNVRIWPIAASHDRQLSAKS